MISSLAYHPSLALFFHYYAHMWHLACKAARGKDSLVADLDSGGDEGDRKRRRLHT